MAVVCFHHVVIMVMAVVYFHHVVIMVMAVVCQSSVGAVSKAVLGKFV